MLFYNRVVYYYTRIFLIFLPHPKLVLKYRLFSRWTNNNLYIYIYIYIYISSSNTASMDSPPLSLSLTIRPYRPSLSAGLPDYILCLYRAVVGRFLLVGQHWHVHVKRSIREYHSRVRPCFSSSVLHALFVLFRWFYKVPVVYWLSSQEMDTATRVQILDQTDCISHCVNTLGKSMNPIILLPAMGKQQDRLGSLALVRQLVQEKENSELKPVKLRLKFDLVSYPARAERLVNMIQMVLEMGSKLLYSYYFVECCFHDLFDIARTLLMHFSTSFFSKHFVSVHAVPPYSRMDTTSA